MYSPSLFLNIYLKYGEKNPCEFNVIGNKGTFNFSKYRKRIQSLKGCIVSGAIKIPNWIHTERTEKK